MFALTAEEQEELRRKEERKDRLHQNYLRRKANGNYNERNQLTSGEYQGKLAQGLVEGILEGLEGKAG